MDLQQSPEELTLLDDAPIYCVYPVSSGLRHRYLLELVQYKKELKEEPKNFGAKAMIEEVEEKVRLCSAFLAVENLFSIKVPGAERSRFIRE